MTRKSTENTVNYLHFAILRKQRQGINVNEVRIGRELAEAIVAFNADVVRGPLIESGITTIFGVPVVIDEKRPMVLEIAVVEEVHVDRGCEWWQKRECLHKKS